MGWQLLLLLTVVMAAQQHVTRVIKALSACCCSRVTAFVPESQKEDTCCGQEWPDSGMSTIRRVSGTTAPSQALNQRNAFITPVMLAETWMAEVAAEAGQPIAASLNQKVEVQAT